MTRPSSPGFGAEDDGVWIAVIRLPSMTTAASSIGDAPVASMTVALVRTVVWARAVAETSDVMSARQHKAATLPEAGALRRMP